MGKKTFLLPLLLLSLMLWLQPITPVSADPVHDVAIVEVSLYHYYRAVNHYGKFPLLGSVVYPRYIDPIDIKVTVINRGDFNESFTVNASYYNATGEYTIGTKNVTLAPGANTTLTFTWYVPKIPKVYPYPIYTFSAEISVVDGETDVAGNSMVDGFVTVRWPGDATGDGKVNIFDLAKVALSWKKPLADPRYNPWCDDNGDGIVDIRDLTILAFHWKNGPLDPI